MPRSSCARRSRPPVTVSFVIALLGCWVALGLARPLASASPIVASEVFRLDYRAEVRSYSAASDLPAGHRVGGTDHGPTVETSSISELRLMLSGRATSFVAFEIAYQHRLDYAPQDTRTIQTPASRAASPARFVDLQWILHRSDDLVWSHVIDRLNLALRLPLAEGLQLIFGRQALEWGYGALWNPADRFSPRRPIELQREYTPGIDAVQLRVSFASLSELRLVVVPVEAAEQLTALARFETRVGPVDLAFTAGDDHDDGLFGLGGRLRLGPTEIEAEVAYFLDPEDDDHAAAVLGVAAQFPWGIRGVLEFSYDGSGVSSPGDATALWASREWREGRRVTVGRWYVGVGLEADPFPFVRVGAKVIVNMEDASAMLHFSFAATVGDAVWVGFDVLTGIGEGGGDGKPGSEFGVAPHTFSLDVRLYF